MAGTSTVKVYYGKPMLPDVSRVLACLYEKNVEFEPVDMYKEHHMPIEFLKLQACARVPVPAFEDGSTKLFVTESRAICRYVAEKYRDKGGSYLLGRDLLERASIEQWLKSEEHSFDPPSWALVFHLAFAPLAGPIEPDRALIEKNEKKLAKVLDVYDQRLGESNYLAGDEFTLADLSHLPNSHYLARSEEWGELFHSRKNVRRWWSDISSRASWKKVVEMLNKVQVSKEEVAAGAKNSTTFTRPSATAAQTTSQTVPAQKGVPASQTTQPASSQPEYTTPSAPNSTNAVDQPAPKSSNGQFTSPATIKPNIVSTAAQTSTSETVPAQKGGPAPQTTQPASSQPESTTPPAPNSTNVVDQPAPKSSNGQFTSPATIKPNIVSTAAQTTSETVPAQKGGPAPQTTQPASSQPESTTPPAPNSTNVVDQPAPKSSNGQFTSPATIKPNIVSTAAQTSTSKTVPAQKGGPAPQTTQPASSQPESTTPPAPNSTNAVDQPAPKSSNGQFTSPATIKPNIVSTAAQTSTSETVPAQKGGPAPQTTQPASSQPESTTPPAPNSTNVVDQPAPKSSNGQFTSPATIKPNIVSTAAQTTSETVPAQKGGPAPQTTQPASSQPESTTPPAPNSTNAVDQPAPKSTTGQSTSPATIKPDTSAS